MASKNKVDFKGLLSNTQQQLAEELSQKEAQFAKMKFAHAVAPLQNPMELRNLRKQIARIQTAITHKKSQAN